MEPLNVSRRNSVSIHSLGCIIYPKKYNLYYPQDNGRTSLEAEKEGNWLVVEDARLEDGGEYTCHISAFHPQEISHSVKIRTRYDHVRVRYHKKIVF